MCPAISGTFQRPPADSRCESTIAIAQRCDTPRFVESQPPFDSISESVKAQLGVIDVVLDYLFLVEEAAVSVIECLGEIPAASQSHASCAYLGHTDTVSNISFNL
jgi:hypothetical protein